MVDAIQVEIKITPPDILRNVEKFFQRPEIIAVIRRTMEKIASRLAGQVVKTKLSGQYLKRRTGILAKSIVGVVITRGGLPAITVGIFSGPALAYAGVQEFGTVGAGGTLPTIRPKNAKALSIPVGPTALTPAGVSRFQSPRDYIGPGELKFIPGQKSIGVLVDDVSDEVEYVLVAKVDIPPKHYLLDTMNENLPKIAQQLATAISKEFTRLVG